MKKVLLWAILCGFAIPGAMAQTGFGLKAGVNMAKMNIEVEKGVKTPSHVSYFVTAFADLPLADQFSIQPGLSLQGKGAKASIKEGENEASVRTNLMAIEIPVNAVYYIPAGTGEVFIGAGPYIGYNISGKYKETVNSKSAEEKIKFSGKDKDMKPLDFGINAMIGYKLFSGLLINAGYGLGLADLNVDKEEKALSNRVFSIGVGFQF